MSNGKVEITFSGTSDLVPVLHRLIRTAAPALPPEPADWVLVKGSHDSGDIAGVYGPYTEAHADWLLSSQLDTSYSNWTKVKLSSGPEELPDDNP